MATVCVNFHGPINHPATTKLRNTLCAVLNDRTPDGKRKHDKLWLLMNSLGGAIDDGFALFGFLRSLPIELTTVNVGMIASIAIAPFLAGKIRIALPETRFHFHDFEWNYAAAHNLTRLEYQDHTQLLNSGRDGVFELLKENTAITDSDLKELKLLEVPVIKDAAFAKERGIVHEVNYLSIPSEVNIFNVDY